MFIIEKLYHPCVFLNNIGCLTKIELILKLYEEVSSSEKDFLKSQPWYFEAYKSIIDKAGQMAQSQFSIRILLAMNFGKTF